MKKTKKILSVILAALFILPVSLGALTGCGDRTEVLKIYNWGEYLADGSYGSINVIAEFESWYKETTGKNIRVEYSVFDTNETMYTQVRHKRADYDLVCPSDYMVQKMRTNELLLPVNDDEFDEIWAEVFADENPEDYGLDGEDELTIRSIMNPMLTDLMVGFDGGWGEADGSVYAIPYIWGTFGIMYDKSKIESIGGDGGADDMQSWEALFGDKYAGHIYMKNSVRDAYGCANIYNSTDELSRLSNGFTDYSDEGYKEALSACLNYPNDDTIASAERTLKAQKKKLYAYEGDEGKDDLLGGKSAAALGLFWSCDAGYVIGMEENTDLWYTVPIEGTNVWMDNWCIPKYAGNAAAAKYFISFINTYDVAYENMWWVGSAVPVRSVCDDIVLEITDPWESAAVANEGLDESDPDYITAEDIMCFAGLYAEGDADAWQAYADMYARAVCPSDEQLERAAVMTDFADKNIDLVRMFIRVKAS